MRIFVMGDIHGAYKAMMQCMERAGFDYLKDTLIQIGDIVDGYDEVYLCVEELLKIKNLVTIKGNHDDWFTEFIQTGNHPAGWAQGGEGTAISYLRLTNREDKIFRSGNLFKTVLTPNDIPENHQQLFVNQQLYYIDDSNNCFVHAGFDRNKAFTEQEPAIYYWDRKLWLAALSYKAYNRDNHQKGKFQITTTFNQIFIGHTNTVNWKTDQPMAAANIYNIDTGAGNGGRLTIMDVSTKKYWQSDSVIELYPKN